MVKKFILLFFMVASVSAQAPDELQAFAKAKRDYEEGHYGPAREAYEQMVREGSRNPAAFVNLGHADYRLGREVEALINYRRALALDPSDAAARHSLEHVQAKLGVPRSGLGFAEIVGHYIPFDLLAWGGTLFFWCGLLAVLFATFSPVPRRGLLVAGVVVALVGVTMTVISWTGDARINLEHQSIVTGEKVEALSAPTETGQKLSSLPPGSEVTIIASRGEWTLVKLPTGIEGWVKSADLQALIPAPAA